MTDLTEQLRNGNLPEGEYYVENKNGNKATMYLWSDAKCKFVVKEAELEILAPVPSYEEYLSLTYAKEEDEKIIAEYEEENAKLKERNDSLNNRDINLCRIANGIRDENFALKELLRECAELMDSTGTIAMHIDVYRQRKKDVLNAITQALGEDK